MSKREFSAVVAFVDRERRITFTAQSPISAWRWITNWAVAQRESEEKPPVSITMHEVDTTVSEPANGEVTHG